MDMDNFREKLNENKGTNVPLSGQAKIKQEAKEVAEWIAERIIYDIAPHYRKEERLHAQFCVTKRYNNQVTVRTPAKDYRGRVVTDSYEVTLSNEARYFEEVLRRGLAEIGIKVSKWNFMQFEDRSTDDFGQNFSGVGGWCVYHQGYYSGSDVNLNPYVEYTETCIKPFFGMPHWRISQGGSIVDLHQAGVLGLIVSYDE